MASRRLFSLPVPGDLETSKSGPWSYRGSSSVHPRSDRPGDGESGLGRTPPPGPNCGIPRCSLTAAMGSWPVAVIYLPAGGQQNCPVAVSWSALADVRACQVPTWWVLLPGRLTGSPPPNGKRPRRGPPRQAL